MATVNDKISLLNALDNNLTKDIILSFYNYFKKITFNPHIRESLYCIEFYENFNDKNVKGKTAPYSFIMYGGQKKYILFYFKKRSNPSNELYNKLKSDFKYVENHPITSGSKGHEITVKIHTLNDAKLLIEKYIKL